MYTCAVRPEIAALSAYVPGMSIAEIQEKYGLSKVVKMASNENPLGVSPLVKEALGLHAGTAFRYPQGGNPRLVAALARVNILRIDVESLTCRHKNGPRRKDKE